MLFSEWLIYYFTDPWRMALNTRLSHQAAYDAGYDAGYAVAHAEIQKAEGARLAGEEA